jgi:ubiquinone/menaquinone biosynthesis C-methylase UbiE
MKDNFSSASDKYAQYRPVYPQELFEFINSNVIEKEAAWDCGTGNGQVACELAKTFNTVFATDISQSQIDNATQAHNIQYSLQAAEKTNFKNDRFDLIIVAQAIHWFNIAKFYAEVQRTAKPDALLIVVGYGRLEITNEIDYLITDFYQNIIGPFWDKERRYIDEAYQTIPFPFDEIQTPDFAITLTWSLEQLIGYLNTWSAVKHFIKQNNYNPANQLQKDLEQCWGDEEFKPIQFPLFLRVGKIRK